MPSEAQERTEPATPRRRQEARRKGTVAKSADLTSSFVMFALAVLLPFLGGTLALGMLDGMRAGLSPTSANFSQADALSHLWKVVAPGLSGLIPVMCIAACAGVAASVMQVGFHVSAEPLNPQMNRLNPVQGLRRLLSRTAFFEVAKTLVKLLVIGSIAWSEVIAHWGELLNLSALEAPQATAWVGGFVGGILLKVALAWLVIGALDYWFQRRQVERQLMMTKEELKRELRETETSPELRAEMQRRRRRLARARMMANVKHADVVVTNPEEYAVALRYEPKRIPAPLVLAKGRGLIAERIRKEAKKHRVPIVPNPPLARSLYEQVEIGDMIPTVLFQAVAEVLAYVFRQKGRRL